MARIRAIYPVMISPVICLKNSFSLSFSFSTAFYISMSISIIVIYSTIYLMFIESCIYWSSTVIHWGVCFLSNIGFGKKSQPRGEERKKKKSSKGYAHTIEYLDYFSKKYIFHFFSFPSLVVLVLLLLLLLLLLGMVFLFSHIYIENISNNLQFSELELVSDHTHGRAGGQRSHGFG